MVRVKNIGQIGEIKMRNIALACIEHQDRLLVFEGPANSTGQRTFRFLGGGIKAGEAPLDAVKRELKEELGAEIEVLELLAVLESHFLWQGQPAHELAHVFRCRFSDGQFDQQDHMPLLDDHTVAFWKPLSTFSDQELLVPEDLMALLDI